DIHVYSLSLSLSLSLSTDVHSLSLSLSRLSLSLHIQSSIGRKKRLRTPCTLPDLGLRRRCLELGGAGSSSGALHSVQRFRERRMRAVATRVSNRELFNRKHAWRGEKMSMVRQREGPGGCRSSNERSSQRVTFSFQAGLRPPQTVSVRANAAASCEAPASAPPCPLPPPVPARPDHVDSGLSM
ncbi:hypothetical protein GOP47_0001197, partial [Adiantum capillus-veneris]